jgi:hypothetical protein
VDLGVVTTVVHFAGQPQSAFPALYVLVVAAYALLMPPTTGERAFYFHQELIS